MPLLVAENVSWATEGSQARATFVALTGVEKDNNLVRGLTAPCSALPGPMILTGCTDSKSFASESTGSDGTTSIGS